MTAAYTTATAIGMAASAALAAPLARLGGGDNWRLGLGVWALISAVSVIPSLATVRDRHGAASAGAGTVVLRPAAVARGRAQ